MNDYLSRLYNDLKNNKLKEYSIKEYDKYFTLTKRGRRKSHQRRRRCVKRQETVAVRTALQWSQRSFEALSLYRSKDIVEKGFGNLKDRLNFRRMQVFL